MGATMKKHQVENIEINQREADRQSSPTKCPSTWPLHEVSHTMFYCHTPQPPLLHFSFCLSNPPLLHFIALTPTEWKTAGLGTAQSTLCPILQWIPIHLSPLLLYPVCSPAPCPHLWWGCAAETKEKQPVWEHVSHSHMVLSSSPSFCEFVSQPYSLVILWCYGWFCFWQAEKHWDIMQLSCMAKNA